MSKKLRTMDNVKSFQESLEYERDKADERHDRKKRFRIKSYLEDEMLKRFKEKRAN